MAIVVLFPIIIWISSLIFRKAGWKVTNYLGDEIPYNLGFCIFLIVLSYSLFVNDFFVFIYLSILWLTGFIDDRYGTKYPKGLKGHVVFFIRTGKITTGLLKLISTLLISFTFTVMLEGNIFEKLTVLLLLILTPHVMNLFDTRPLRVWKFIAAHLLILFPIILLLPFPMLFIVGIIVIELIYFEGARKGMLGDNGATLLGGIISIVVIYQLTLGLQWLLIIFYLFIVVVTERISISEWIEKKPLVKRIDRWGIS